MRKFFATRFLALVAGSMIAPAAMAVSLSDLTSGEANSGLRAALEKGSIAAVAKLGVKNGGVRNVVC